MTRLQWLRCLFAWGLGVVAPLAAALPAGAPIVLAIDAEFGHSTSTSAPAIQRGAEIAIDEINAAGGVLGRPMALTTRDNHAVPSRSVENVKALAADPAVVAIMGGKFSPAVLEASRTAQSLGVPLLAAWSAADGITDRQPAPSWIFRLSLRDSWALEAMLKYALARGWHEVGLLLPNTSWGRSSLAAAQSFAVTRPQFKLVATTWYNWGDKSLLKQYQQIRSAGAKALVLVANEAEGGIALNEIAALPKTERLPVVAHWGVTGGAFHQIAGDALRSVDFAVVQTYSFVGSTDPLARRVLGAYQARYGVADPRRIESAVGVAHAYDLTHLLARAIAKAGSTDRKAVRDALEHLGEYRGLVRRYAVPFTPARHEALSADNAFMASYQPDGALVGIGRR